MPSFRPSGGTQCGECYGAVRGAMHAPSCRATATGHHCCGYVSCECGAGCDDYCVRIHCFAGVHIHGCRNWHAGVQHV
ncbi:hypothetical protein [Rock bream iridovirus]|uniref:ORF063L n=4 Tax=Infectious spleen and kidney necrosis virus TaxID=180170 RepID=Q5YF24_ISKNV|nr:ORF063L [Rock bream iridovirus]AAX82376.1 ORF67L [Orange-spotted grouper iridovirus]AGG37944.1 hypothetical protein [Rock bream iridovirus]AMM04478.1 ORF074L [Infectious spleen and kidney necrosis virus]AMM72698.1 ORF071L [giant sea perch iridovirus - K1]